MCGIAGFNLCDKDHGVINSHKLAVELLSGIQSRGRDATGAAWFEEQAEGPTLYVQKQGIPAYQFTKSLDMPENTRTAILHTRLATQGSHTVYENNHPVISGNTVGVHNGMLWNDNQLFRDMGITHLRAGEVDTEAAFAAINYGREVVNGKPRLADSLMGALEAIEGTAALAWLEIEGNPDVLHLARVESSPVWFAQTPNGSFIFASEKSILDKACKAAGVELLEFEEMREGDYFRMKDGRICDVSTFKVQTRRSYTSGSYKGGATAATYGYWGEDDGFDSGGWNRDGGFKSNTGFRYVHKDKRTTSDTEAKVTSISEYAKLGGKAAEEPKAINTTDTAGAIVDAIAKNDAKNERAIALAALAAEVERHPSAGPFLNDDDMYDHTASALSVTRIDRIDGDEHYYQYEVREAAIETYMEGLSGDEQDVLDTMMDLHALLRVGDWVVTNIGHEEVYGQVWLMPQTFPHNGYLIRGLLDNGRYKNGFEPVIVERQCDEFVKLSDDAFTDELTK